MHTPDDHFAQFAKTLEKRIESYGETRSTKEFLERQKFQVEELQRLESEFRKALIRHRWGPTVYRAFVKYIREERNNILAARPFFRERAPVFTAHISKALQTSSHVSLYQFHFNYQFVLFAMRACDWPKRGKLAKLARDIESVRLALIEQNMPLAISRARIFWRYARAHLSYMDLVQIAYDGLASGVDKYVGPYSRSFRATIIGRITGNLIEENSETMLHFFPSDRRKLYNANKALKEHIAGDVDFQKLANDVNASGKGSYTTTPDEIASLVAAASVVSADAQPAGTQHAEEPVTESIERFAADPELQPDILVEKAEARAAMFAAIERLPILERKILVLKGVSLA